jgi:hypothetical protein
MFWIGFWVLVLVGYLLFVYWGSKPVYHRDRTMAELGPLMDAVLQAGVGSVMIVQHESSERFVQFAQRSEVLGVNHLVFGFPDAPWSRRYFEPVAEHLDRNGIQYRIVETGEEPTRRFIKVDIEGSSDTARDRATDVARVAANAMGLPAEAKFTVHVDGTSDHARWAWDNRDHLESLRSQGGFQGRVAAASLLTMNGRRVDPEEGSRGEQSST